MNVSNDSSDDISIDSDDDYETAGGGHAGTGVVTPPSTAITAPVMNEASSLAKNAATLPHSSMVPILPKGCWL